MEEKRGPLSPSEWRVMECLWTGPKTLMELVRTLKDSAGWTKSTVNTMVRRMEEKGVIKSFSINVDRTLLDSNLTGFILIALFPEKYGQFCQFCETTPSIIAHHHLVGKLNGLLRFAVKDTHELDQLLSIIKQFGDSQTSVELGAYFEQKDVPLPK